VGIGAKVSWTLSIVFKKLKSFIDGIQKKQLDQQDEQPGLQMYVVLTASG
jgi:hypothetical protein